MVSPLVALFACTPTVEPPLPPPPAPTTGFHAEPDFRLAGAPSAQLRPILIVSIDTARADRLRLHGGRAETPGLVALAAEGVRFDQAVSHFPQTCPSHWSMFTGVMPEVHGDLMAHAGSVYPGPTLAEIAGRAGYATAAFIGGITLRDASCGLARGFDVYDDHVPGGTEDLKRPGAEVARRALAWIARQDGPWFAFVHLFDAHTPYTPSPPWSTRYDPDYRGSFTGSAADLAPFLRGEATPSPDQIARALALYDGELSEVDALLGPLVQAAGPEAVVVVTADHGESFDHGYYFNHARAVWDGVMRVPLVVRAPGLPAGEVVGRQVGLVDLAPTVLELAGLPPDTRMQGASATGLARGEGGTGRPIAFATTDPLDGAPAFAARTETTKLIASGGETRAFDLLADPGETTPLDSIPPDLEGARARYVALVEALREFQVPAPPAARGADPRALEALGYVEGRGRSPRGTGLKTP